MANDCVEAVKKKFSESITGFEESRLVEMQRFVDDLAVETKGDTKLMQERFNEELPNFLSDSETVSVQKVENVIKQENILREVFNPEGLHPVDKSLSASDRLKNISKNFKIAKSRILDIYDGKNSVSTRARFRAQEYMNGLESELKSKASGRAFENFSSGEFDKEIFEVNWRIANGQEGKGSPEVMEIISAIKDTNALMLGNLNDAGLSVKFRKDYLLGRSMNSEKLRLLERDGFVDLLMKDGVLDKEKVFSQSNQSNPEAQRKILGDIYDDIMTSRRTHSVSSTEVSTNHYKKLKSRKLEFASGTAEHEFFLATSGTDTLKEGVIGNMHSTAKAVANVTILGTTPEKAHAAMLDKLVKIYGGPIPEEKLGKTLSVLTNAFIDSVAPQNSPMGNLNKAAKIIRTTLAATKLGSTVFTAAYDVSTSALALHKVSGENILGAHSEVIKGFLNPANWTKEGRLRTANALNTMSSFSDLSVTLGGIAGDFSSGKDWYSRAMSGVIKFSGVPLQTKMSMNTTATAIVHAFTNIIDDVIGGKQLNELARGSLDLYKITDSDLRLISKHAKRSDVVKGAYTPKDIIDMPLSAFSDNIKEARRKRFQLHDKFSSYLDDASNQGTPTPDNRTRRVLHKGSTTDPNLKAVIDIVTLFKETALKMTMDSFDTYKFMMDKQGLGKTAWTASQGIAASMATFLAIEELKAQLMNKESPLDLLRKEDYKKFTREFIRKGSLFPTLSDQALSLTSDNPFDSFAKTAVGPVGSIVDDFGKILTKGTPVQSTRDFVSKQAFPSTNWLWKGFQNNALGVDLITGKAIKNLKND